MLTRQGLSYLIDLDAVTTWKATQATSQNHQKSSKGLLSPVAGALTEIRV
jgi:hypothetical protein